jgi:CRISPR-associated protein Csb2
VLTLRCTLLGATFEGGSPDNPRVAEWPPSWMRLFSALVSVADEGVDDDLLRALERSDPPEIYATKALRPDPRLAYVPTNAIPRKGGEAKHTVLIGRTNAGEPRRWARTVPRSREIWYRFAGLDLNSEQRERLGSVCKRVPYFGRSTSPVLVELVDTEPPAADWLVPATALADQRAFAYAATVRCPFPGALDALRAAYRAKYLEGGAGDPWEVGVGIDYGAERPVDIPEEVIAGPYPTMVVLSLEGRRLDGRHAARVTYAFRHALLARAERQISTLHGHHDGDVLQCAALALPFVDAERADGHLLGVALAIPDLATDDLAVVDGALPRPGEEMEVTAGPLGVLRFLRVTALDASRSAWGLQPRRWIGPARSWMTALPMVFDRFLKRDSDIEAEVRRAVVNSRLPEPEAMWVSRRPLLRGAPDLAPTDTVRRQTDTAVKPYRHVALRFPQPISGPVVVGSMRHYGLGLCAPITEG